MKFVKSLIWLGFAALLLVSIPKLAWVFRSFEDKQAVPIHLAGTQVDILWFAPLLVALCIDALQLSLTYAMSVDKAKSSQVGMWSFVALLCGLSYFCNLLYNYAHAPAGSIWTDPFVAFATPLIVSGVPMFALCYTLILSRIEGKGETLAEKAARLEAERDAKDRIKAAHSGRITGRIKDAISGAGDIAKHAATTFANTEHAQAKDAQIAVDPAPASDGVSDAKMPEETQPETQEPQTDKIPAITAEHDGTFTGKKTPNSHEQNTAPDVPQTRITGKLSVTVKEAATLLNLSESYVRELRNKNVLRHPSRNKRLVTIKSINEYAAAQQKPAQNERHTDELPVAELAAITAGNSGELMEDTAPHSAVQPTR